ncbi:hypothetical protein INH39_25465 [Massilia violaceinigra]|uniref:Uncharacterized protein n=1 Tax=Massilia violaceinigra TaxID=2045208 RepID=A0ABY4A1X5_9BURK|nr:hypothetical protein [Massilia violaceinigra]UOD28760.1 hypothetical protein INH39_25465 [Massilia violaceinigra]
MKSQSCANCAYGQFTYTPSGRIKAKVPGRCLAPLPVVIVAECVAPLVFAKTGIWPDMGFKCAVWMARP